MNTNVFWFFGLHSQPRGRLVGVIFLVVMMFLLLQPDSSYSAPGAWYDEEFHRLLKKHQCQELTIYQKAFPFFQLWTDEVFVAWCKDVSLEAPQYTSFHLIIIPRSPTHSWANCPRFSRSDSTQPLYIWMDKPTLKYGQPTSLSDLYYESEYGQPLKPGPSDIQATGPSLWVGLPTDVASFRYCYQGSWLHGSED